MSSPGFAPVCWDRVSLSTMRRESVHGLCGRAAEMAIFNDGQSEQSLLPRDVLDHLGDAFKEL